MTSSPVSPLSQLRAITRLTIRWATTTDGLMFEKYSALTKGVPVLYYTHNCFTLVISLTTVVAV